MVELSLFVYDDSDFFSFRLTFEFKVELYFHNASSFRICFTKVRTRDLEPNIYLEHT